MNIQEYRQLQAERATLENLLEQLPASSVIERKGLEFRKKEVEETLASQPAPSRQPAQVRLTFRGRPTVGTHGIFADFGANAVKAFTDAVAAIGASQRTRLRAFGMLPFRGDYQLLITSTALGSFGFELEEVPHYGSSREVSPVESALKQTMSILKATVGTDETWTETMADADPRVLKLLSTFLKKLADQGAVCALEFGDEVFRFSDVGQVRRSEKRLSQEGIDEEGQGEILRLPVVSQVRQIESHSIQKDTDEEEQEFSGRFRGVLPTRRTFEFLNEATGEVISGEIDFAIEDVDAINKLLNRPANIKVRSGQGDTTGRRYVLLAYKDASGQDEN